MPIIDCPSCGEKTNTAICPGWWDKTTPAKCTGKLVRNSADNFVYAKGCGYEGANKFDQSYVDRLIKSTEDSDND